MDFFPFPDLQTLLVFPVALWVIPREEPPPFGFRLPPTGFCVKKSIPIRLTRLSHGFTDRHWIPLERSLWKMWPYLSMAHTSASLPSHLENHPKSHAHFFLIPFPSIGKSSWICSTVFWSPDIYFLDLTPLIPSSSLYKTLFYSSDLLWAVELPAGLGPLDEGSPSPHGLE